MQKYFSFLFASLCLAILIFLPLLNLSWYPLHDSTHISRVLLLDQTLRGGQFPAIWADGINNGLGYPLFHFYAPLFYYVAVMFSQFFGVIIALKITLFLTSTIGIFGVALLIRRYLPEHRGVGGAAILGAAAWAFSPYGALDLYVRGAFAEYLALSLLPWVLLTFSSLTNRAQTIKAGIVLALFLLSHNLIPLLSLPLIVIWGLLHNRHSLRRLFMAGALAVGLSVWFITPLIFERHFTHADSIAQTTSYSLHFVSPWQIWNSTWGFGGSGPGVEDGMSFKLGKLQLTLALFGLLLALKLRQSYLIIIGIFAGFFLYLATPLSASLWSALPFLPLVQFPWRSLGISAVLLATLAGFTPIFFRNQTLRLIYCIFMLGGLITLNLKYFTPQTLINPPVEIVDIARIVPEYLPRWLQDFSLYPTSASERAYYPTWRVKIDGHLVPTFPDSAGLLSYSNPNNSPDIELIQSHTILEKMSLLLSLLTLLVITFTWAKSRHD